VTGAVEREDLSRVGGFVCGRLCLGNNQGIMTLHRIALVLLLTVASALCAPPTKESLEKALAENPNDATALYNMGLLSYFEGAFEDASRNWEKLKILEPKNWQVREKLIQAYYAQGNMDACNQEIAQIRAARKSGEHEELQKKGFVIRDQFAVGDVQVAVLEYYELEGDRPRLWKFLLTEDDEFLRYHYSLGSYPSTSEYPRAIKEIGENDRIYHLDGYRANGVHKTFGFYVNQPSYTAVRGTVIKILKGEAEEISSTTPDTPPAASTPPDEKRSEDDAGGK
jgi:tetratricopeptide (TPR) repeat protein